MQKDLTKIGLSAGTGGRGGEQSGWELRQLAGDTLLYAVTASIVRLVTFLLTPLYTNFLQPAALGEVSYLFALLAFVNVVLALGWESAYMRFAVEEPEPGRGPIFAYAWSTMVVNGAILCGCGWMLAPSIAPVLRLGELGAEGIRAAAAIAFLDVVAVVPYAELRLRRRLLWYALLRLVNVGVLVGATVVFVLLWGWGARGVLWAGVAASASTAVGIIPVVVRALRWRWRGQLYREMLQYALPAVPAALAGIALHVLDRPLLMVLSDAAAVGIYQANYRLALPMVLMVSVFEYAWRPFFLQRMQRDDAPQLFARVFWYWNLWAAGLFVVLVVWMPVLARLSIGDRFLIHPAYWEGLSVVPVVAAGYVLFGVYVFAAAAAHIRRKTERLAVAMVAAVGVNVGLLLVLVPRWGYMGAAWATLGAYAVAAVVMVWMGRRLYPIPYPWGRVAGAWGSALVMAAAGYSGQMLERAGWTLLAAGLLWGWWRLGRRAV